MSQQPMAWIAKLMKMNKIPLMVKPLNVNSFVAVVSIIICFNRVRISFYTCLKDGARKKKLSFASTDSRKKTKTAKWSLQMPVYFVSS